jgi:HrpA-like RNA helicase
VQEKDQEEAFAVRRHRKFRLTPAGHFLAKLPTDVHVGRVLLFGTLLRCLDPALTVAAVMSASKSMFITQTASAPVLADLADTQARVVETSDHLCAHHHFRLWQAASTRSRKEGQEYLRRYGLNRMTMEEIRGIKQQLKGVVLGLDLSLGYDDALRKDPELMWRHLNEYSLKNEAVLTALSCGLYPDVARISTNHQLSQARASGSSKEGVALVQGRAQQRLFISPNSVNASIVAEKKQRTGARDRDQWLAFDGKMKTSKIYVARTSVVHSKCPLAWLLLCGQGSQESLSHADSLLATDPEQNLVVLDKWIELSLLPGSALMVNALRGKARPLIMDQLLPGKTNNGAGEASSRSEKRQLLAKFMPILADLFF